MKPRRTSWQVCAGRTFAPWRSSLRAIPVIFRRPVVAVVERPLLAAIVVAAIQQALGELGP